MNKLLPVLLLAILGSISQSSLAQWDHFWDHNRLGWGAQTATAAGRVRVIITKPKVKLHLLKAQRPIARLFLDDTDDDYYDETPDFQIGYRRPELVDQTVAVHDDISDEIKLRLVLARKKALIKYHKNWG